MEFDIVFLFVEVVLGLEQSCLLFIDEIFVFLHGELLLVVVDISLLTGDLASVFLDLVLVDKLFLFKLLKNLLLELVDMVSIVILIIIIIFVQCTLPSGVELHLELVDGVF